MAFAGGSLVFSLVAFAFSLWAVIDLLASKRSTHKIQFIDPLAGLNEPQDEATREAIREAQAEFERRATDPLYRPEASNSFYGGK